MTTTTRLITPLAILAAAAATALATPKPYIASPDGNIYRLDASDHPELVASLAQPLVAIDAQEDHLIVADNAGRVMRVDPATGSVLATYQVWPGAATAVSAAPGNQIFVSDATSTIAYLDADGNEVDTYYAGLQVSAMVIKGDNLVIGSPNTFILEAPFGDPNFTFISACGGIVNSLALTPTKLFAGDANGTVYRFNASGGAYEGTFLTSTDAKGIEFLDAELLVAGSDGTLEHMNPDDGTISATHALGVPVAGITVADFACAADLSLNGVLNIDDINTFAQAFVAGNLAADLDHSGSLDIDDINAFASSFLAGCP